MGQIGSSEAREDLILTREGIHQINDAVYELHAPAGVPDVEIVFFHGLQPFDYKDAHWQTWLTGAKNSNELWPQTWLPRDFRSARILSISYDSSAQEGSAAGRTDMFLIGENLVQNIVLSKDAHVGQTANCPVIFVGHSLGGLVIKKVILSARKKLDQLSPKRAHNVQDVAKLESFLQNIKGVFYFATPHQGSSMADVAKMTDFIKVLPQRSEVLKFLTVLNKEGARLNDEFRVWRENNNVRAWTLFELLPTIFAGFGKIVVEEGSARFDADKFYGAQEDHISICKLEKQSSTSYQFFTEFITECTGLDKRMHQEDDSLIV
ncbi:hypothetical protein AXG93_4689s1620 [Marchantia polymorpha subsp. ruderalis]|uniref:DUF676 domain-containing protein n=1 Tax=Marchantia polymorpha subsp. ruderalis TaxID=1480154 RepID=A0A176WML4_MARPO|nr:hypothetical protein AXG93_4689s1620 [Marchantia polymorpha subsp. ruderalis]